MEFDKLLSVESDSSRCLCVFFPTIFEVLNDEFSNVVAREGLNRQELGVHFRSLVISLRHEDVRTILEFVNLLFRRTSILSILASLYSFLMLLLIICLPFLEGYPALESLVVFETPEELLGDVHLFVFINEFDCSIFGHSNMLK